MIGQQTYVTTFQSTIQREEVQDYRDLYQEAMRKVRQFTSIENTIQDATSAIHQEQIHRNTANHQQRIDQISQSLFDKQNEHAFLIAEAKRLRQINEQKERFYQLKLQFQLKNKEVLKEQMFLVRQQMKIIKKQLENEKQIKAKYLKMLNSKEKLSQFSNFQVNDDKNDYERVKQIIKGQQEQIQTQIAMQCNLKGQLCRLKQKLQTYQTKLHQTAQLHQIELNSKNKTIEFLQKQIEDKQGQMKSILRKIEQISRLNSQFQRSTQMNEKLQSEVSLKDLQIKRNKQLIVKYEQMNDKIQKKQQQLYAELIGKDIELEKCQQRQKSFMDKIQWLTSMVQELKGSYIHSQLEKQGIYQKYKQEQKSLKISRSINLSTSQLKKSNLKANNTNSTVNKGTINLDKSNSSLSTSAFTPTSSMNNSRLLFGNQTFIRQKQNINIHQSQDQQANSKSKLYQLKKNFYKSKTSKKQPFQN